MGDLSDDHRGHGMGIVVEYAGHSGKPRWVKRKPFLWDCTRFGKAAPGIDPERPKLVEVVARGARQDRVDAAPERERPCVEWGARGRAGGQDREVVCHVLARGNPRRVVGALTPALESSRYHDGRVLLVGERRALGRRGNALRRTG
jgi:hypothetical protein